MCLDVSHALSYLTGREGFVLMGNAGGRAGIHHKTHTGGESSQP
jgi:hypothetical protein